MTAQVQNLPTLPSVNAKSSRKPGRLPCCLPDLTPFSPLAHSAVATSPRLSSDITGILSQRLCTADPLLEPSSSRSPSGSFLHCLKVFTQDLLRWGLAWPPPLTLHTYTSTSGLLIMFFPYYLPHFNIVQLQDTIFIVFCQSPCNRDCQLSVSRVFCLLTHQHYP